MKPKEIFFLAGGLVIVVAVLVMFGMVIAKYVDLPLIGPAPPTPTPAITREAQPLLADDVERLSKGDIDVVDLRPSGDLSMTMVVYISGEEISEDVFVSINALLAEQFQIVRLINLAIATQSGNEIYVINAIFDCVRNTDDETSEEVPLICVLAEEQQTGQVIPDEGIRYLNEVR